jgi:hypothetical protein
VVGEFSHRWREFFLFTLSVIPVTESLASQGILPLLDDVAILPHDNASAYLFCPLPGFRRRPFHGDFRRRQIWIAFFRFVAGSHGFIAHVFTPSSMRMGSLPELS